jgi:hypothetical protein
MFSVQVATPTILYCEVTHDPSATVVISWLKDDMPLTLDERVRFLEEGVNGNIQIQSVEFKDAGRYQCQVNTSYEQIHGPLVHSEVSTVEVTGQYNYDNYATQ